VSFEEQKQRGIGPVLFFLFERAVFSARELFLFLGCYPLWNKVSNGVSEMVSLNARRRDFDDKATG
jgi:hypothetical protein